MRDLVVVAGAELQLSGAVFQYRNRPFHPRSISPYARLERFACLSFLNRLTVSPAIHHNEESTAGIRIERTFSLPITAICIAVAGIEPAVMPCSSMLSSLCADLTASMVGMKTHHDFSPTGRDHHERAAPLAFHAPHLSR